MQRLLRMVNCIGYLNYLKGCGIIPNFSELERVYNKDRRTLKRYYDNGGIPKRKKRDYHSEFDDYIDIIKSKLEEPGNTKRGIYEFLVDIHKIKTTYNNFKAYCLRKGLKLSKSTLTPHPRYETDPSEQLQVDWKEDLELVSRHGETFHFNIYSATLGYSRKHVFLYTVNKTKSDFLRCTIDTYKILGGLPKKIITDNMSAVVTVNGHKKYKHPKILAFEKDTGVKIKLCKSRTPQTKGKDESANRFVNRLKAYNNDFEDLTDLLRIIDNLNVRCNEECNQTTKIPPNILFQKEKEYLSPLPNQVMLESYLDGSYISLVPETMLINYKGNSYSVPKEYIGKSVKCVPDNNKLYIYFNTKLIHSYDISSQKINYDRNDYIDALKTITKSSGNDIEELALKNLERFSKYGK